MAEIDWNITLKAVAVDLGNQIFDAAKTSVADAWTDIEEANRNQLRVLATIMGQLKIREMVGEDVSELVAHIEAQIANLKFVNKSVGSRAVKAFWMKVLDISGSILFSLAKKAIGLP